MRIFARVVVGLGLLYYLVVSAVVVGLSRESPLSRELTFAAVAVVLLSVMSVGLRRAAGLTMQRVALVGYVLRGGLRRG